MSFEVTKAELTYLENRVVSPFAEEQKHAEACGVEVEIVQGFTVKVDSLESLTCQPANLLLVHLRCDRANDAS